MVLIVPALFAGRRALIGLLLGVPVLVTSFVLAPYAWVDFFRVIPNLLSGPALFANNLALQSVVSYALPGLPWAADVARVVSVAGGLAALPDFSRAGPAAGRLAGGADAGRRGPPAPAQRDLVPLLRHAAATGRLCLATRRSRRARACSPARRP